MWRLMMASLFVLCLGRGVLAQEELPAAITILNITGDITYLRSDFQGALPVQAGHLILASDALTADEDAVLQVICPNGDTGEFLAVQITDEGTLPCPTDDAIVGAPGLTSLRVQRGGRQDPTIPYLIAPRGTLVREPAVTLSWNAPPDVEYFTLTVRAASQPVWTKQVFPADAVHDGIAQIELPVTLEPNIPYTVEICVLFTSLRERCTTEAGWNASVNVAFYYVPDPDLDVHLEAFDTDFGPMSAEARYAQAVVLSQPVEGYSPDDTPIGYYAEAIALLEALLRDTPDHPLAQSPATFNLLGELYRSTSLPISAARMYQRGVQLAIPITEPATMALLGSAITTPAGDQVYFYTGALESAFGYLRPEPFIRYFEQICGMIGDTCGQLPQCSTVQGANCAAWHKKD